MLQISQLQRSCNYSLGTKGICWRRICIWKGHLSADAGGGEVKFTQTNTLLGEEGLLTITQSCFKH